MMARKQERGIALVIVLWVGLLVVAIAGAFIADTRSSTQMARNFLDNAEARAMADGGVHLAIFELARLDSEPQIRRDGEPIKHVVPGGTLEMFIESEVGKIDLNNASDELLAGLFQSAGIDGEKAGDLVAAVEKFREDEEERIQDRLRNLPDETVRTGRTQFIKTAKLSNQNRSGGARAFQSVDSLGQVNGMTAELHARLRSAITVYGATGLDYLTSPREALLAIPGVSVEAVDTFLENRGGEPPDDPLQEFLTQGRARDHWQESEGNAVTVKVLAELENGAKFVRIALVELSDDSEQPFVVREWREGSVQSIRRDKSPSSEDENLSGGAT
jgi:general secretion pathway protein K